MCLTLEPFKECGYGTCVNNSCVCDPGFSQSEDFLYREVPANITVYCDYSNTITVAMATSLLILVCITFTAQLFVLENKRQVRAKQQ